MKKILIIGGEGYIGNVISQTLLFENYQVTSFDNLLYQNELCPLNKFFSNNYNFIYGDMANTKQIKHLIEESDVVILLAGLVGDPITKNYPNESYSINDKAVKNVIDLCSMAKAKRFIFISTCSNYGLIEDDELANEEYDLNPLSLYAKSKVNAEKYILSLKNSTSMQPAILRFATAFGLSPRMRFDLTISEFTREMLLGNNLLVYDANTWRPYCHVKDFARLIKMVINAPEEIISFEVFNAGGDINNATKQMIVDKIIDKVPEGKVTFQDHGSDPRNYRVDFRKVKSVLGFEPRYTIDDGIEELVNAFQNHAFDYVENNKNFFGNYEINYPIPL